MMKKIRDEDRGVLIAVGGLSGSGKSTLAGKLVENYAGDKKVIWLRTDEVRKELWGIPYSETLPEEAYKEDVSHKTYLEVDRRMNEALAEGHFVVADTVFATEFGRNKAEETAASNEANFVGIWLDVPPEVMRQRVTDRTDDVSDADSSVVDLQLTFNLGSILWQRFDASGTPEQAYDAAASYLHALGLEFNGPVLDNITPKLGG